VADSPDLLLAQDMGRFYADPLGFVMYAYPWDSNPALQMVELASPYDILFNSKYGPDKWACDLLEDLGREIKARMGQSGALDPIRIAVASGHGIGKSALTAWLVDFIMSTRPFAQGTVTAATAPQLESRTWAQIAKWTKLCVTGHWFDVTTGRGSMKLVNKLHRESWYCNAQTCREENSEAFAGQHAANSTSFYLFDEASAVPDAIEEVSKGGLTDGEPMVFAFGNPTRNTGWFKECFNGQAHRWLRYQIDSRDVQITNKKYLQELIDDYGIDSDLVKVRVRGLFPSMSIQQFISEADVDAAYGRHLRLEQYNFAPKILTLDNAWEGDDEGVIGLRQGLKFTILETFQKNDNDNVIGKKLADLEDLHKADAVFIDAGYGTGVVSYGRTVGRDHWMLIWFSGESTDPGCLNKRAEMWNAGKQWLKMGGSIQPDPVLRRDLTGPETVPRLDGKIQLESKKDMKRRGLASPGRGDSLMLSFAHPVSPKVESIAPVRRGAVVTDFREYDPFANSLN